MRRRTKAVKKILIKIIKQKDVKGWRNVKTQIRFAAKQTALKSEEKSKRHSRREIVETVSNWIPERKENKRLEELAAFRKFFGNEFSLSEIQSKRLIEVKRFGINII
jgi:hypothetical protein